SLTTIICTAIFRITSYIFSCTTFLDISISKFILGNHGLENIAGVFGASKEESFTYILCIAKFILVASCCLLVIITLPLKIFNLIIYLTRRFGLKLLNQ